MHRETQVGNQAWQRFFPFLSGPTLPQLGPSRVALFPLAHHREEARLLLVADEVLAALSEGQASHSSVGQAYSLIRPIAPERVLERC